MKKQPLSKLQLRKSVIANLNKSEMAAMAGGNGPTQTRVPQLCIQDQTARSCGVNCPGTSQTCNSVRICNDGQLQTVEVPCHI